VNTTTLRQALVYQPVELEFGTSGLRGLVGDITDLEAYVATRAFLQFLREAGDARAGSAVFVAGDLRPSTGDILVPVSRAIVDAGFSPTLLGRIPSPALLLYAMRRRSPSVMVTGSHIPFDRNGIKLNRSDGEVRKADEQVIRGAQKRLRDSQYDAPFVDSMFDEHGALRPRFRIPLPPEIQDAGSEYVSRYTETFPPGILTGKRVLVYQHSAVGRDLLVAALEGLGASVVPAGRSDTFVPVDTEAVNEEMLQQIQRLVDANGADALDAVVSTDGDGDRPLVLGVEAGKVRFYPGDILGIVTADFVGARAIAVPISVNDAVDAHFSGSGITLAKTRIGSPYVIDAMTHVGWEANGGFLTAASIAIPAGGILDQLPTRDALLPILAVLCASLGRGETLSGLFSRLPARFGKSGLLRNFPRDKALAIVRRFSLEDPSLLEVRRDCSSPGLWSLRRTDGTQAVLAKTDLLDERIRKICGEVTRFFTAQDGFAEVSSINWLDGVRIGFENGDIAHIRPSGNAPELRLYANAGTPERAEAIVKLGTAESGILRQLAAAVEETQAIDVLRSSPRVLLLKCSVRHYAWGGFQFIPSLLGESNPQRLPCAELWIGAHPIAPSWAILDGMKARLDRLVEASPNEVLGARDAARFAGKLPFLMKVLDARLMLSIQAHPTLDQAAAGFARENEKGIPIDAPQRMYRDANHKPETHVALSELWMLHGFRPLEEIGEVLALTPEFGRLMPDFASGLRAAAAEPAAREKLLRDLYTSVMTLPQGPVDELLSPLIERLSVRERSGALDKDSPDFWALRASRDLPLPDGHMDRGIFSIYLLNLLHLHPGEGTYQPAGTLHAYLEGTNVELMANSDNVLRGGLTSKVVDTAELLRIVSYHDGRSPVLTGRELGNGVRIYETPAREFVLERVELGPNGLLHAGSDHAAECLITIEGSARLASGEHELDLSKGRAALAPASVPYELRSAGARALVFRARIP